MHMYRTNWRGKVADRPEDEGGRGGNGREEDKEEQHYVDVGEFANL